MPLHVAGCPKLQFVLCAPCAAGMVPASNRYALVATLCSCSRCTACRTCQCGTQREGCTWSRCAVPAVPAVPAEGTCMPVALSPAWCRESYTGSQTPAGCGHLKASHCHPVSFSIAALKVGPNSCFAAGFVSRSMLVVSKHDCAASATQSTLWLHLLGAGSQMEHSREVAATPRRGGLHFPHRTGRLVWGAPAGTRMTTLW